MSVACRLLVALLCLYGASALADPALSNAWSRVSGPSGGPAEAIGSYAHGCLAGGAALPIDGPGYEAIRLSRRRAFGHPDIVDYVETLGRRAVAAKLPRFRVGDMSQPRGGPLPFGHASHQTGLDADIWFALDSGPLPPPGARELPALPSMLARPGEIDPARFGPAQIKLLELAAEDERVERIFVNPAIKLALCRGYGGATKSGTGWLHTLRPWWGHDDHFHVRLRCPPDSTECEAQKPVEPGDGCDAELESWGRRTSKPAAPTKPPTEARPLPKLLPACDVLLTTP
jgi:penicillin-insensitive murein endopeptidase